MFTKVFLKFLFSNLNFKCQAEDSTNNTINQGAMNERLLHNLVHFPGAGTSGMMSSKMASRLFDIFFLLSASVVQHQVDVGPDLKHTCSYRGLVEVRSQPPHIFLKSFNLRSNPPVFCWLSPSGIRTCDKHARTLQWMSKSSSK